MKTVVIPNDISIPTVISDEMYQKYLSHLELDIDVLLKKSGKLERVPCPGCGGGKGVFLAQKMCLTYEACPDCGSYFVNPRPSQEMLNAFYKDSEACRSWRTDMAKLTDEKLYYIYGPRVEWISECVDEALGRDPVLLDVHTKYPFLIKHIEKEAVFKKIRLLDPQLFEKEALLSREFYLSPGQVDYDGQVDMVTLFEGVERMAHPLDFFIQLGKYCKPGGLLLLTTATSSGFEYQILREKSPNLNPINRLNLLSLEAISAGLEAAGFEVTELSTPGRLDVEIVRQALSVAGAGTAVDPFWKYVFSKRNVRAFQGLQRFLQENRLSSHVRVVAKKK